MQGRYVSISQQTVFAQSHAWPHRQLKLLDAIAVVVVVVVVDDDAGAFGWILILDVLPSTQCPHWCFERGHVQQIEDHPQ